MTKSCMVLWKNGGRGVRIAIQSSVRSIASVVCPCCRVASRCLTSEAKPYFLFLLFDFLGRRLSFSMGEAGAVLG